MLSPPPALTKIGYSAEDAKSVVPMHGAGCEKCNNTGYKGRVGIHELMVNNEELIDGINKELETAELKRICMKHGMKTLHQDSMLKVQLGVTSMEEALATAPPDTAVLAHSLAPITQFA